MLVNPFTARSGTDPKVFVGREDELDFFKNDRLAKAVEGRCQHYVVTGTWGIGKTVLLRQMKLLAQKQGAWALLFCIRAFNQNENLTAYARHVLDMATAELPIRSKKRKQQRTLQGVGATAFTFGVQVQWDSQGDDGGQDPQLLLRDGFYEMFRYAENHGAKALVLMIDDVHNLPPSGEQLTLLRNVLTDERIVGKTKILVVLSSIEQGWEPFLERDHPVGRLFLPQRPLDLFDQDRTSKLIESSLRGTGVSFENDLKRKVFDVTQGHIFEIQALCESLFDRQIKGKVSLESWDAALEHTLLALADAHFKGMLSRASEQERLALQVLASSTKALGPSAVAKRCSRIKSAAEYLKRLASKGLVERVRRGQYRIADKLFAEYVKRKVAS